MWSYSCYPVGQSDQIYFQNWMQNYVDESHSGLTYPLGLCRCLAAVKAARLRLECPPMKIKEHPTLRILTAMFAIADHAGPWSGTIYRSALKMGCGA